MNIPIAPPPLMTTEELLALPDDGVERWLIDGHLREKPMTVRNRWHGRTEARVAQLLGDWLDLQSQPRGEVYSGEVGFRLRRDPDTTVGTDAAYVSPEVAAENPDETTLIEGVPILAIEILSPSDVLEEIRDKIRAYLRMGVALVWVIDPYFETVTVHRPGARPKMFDADAELTAEPHLPGLRIPVDRLFRR